MNSKKIITVNPSFLFEILSTSQVVLFSEDKHYLLDGEIYVDLIRLIGVHPLSQNKVFAILSHKYPIQLIHKAIQRVFLKGFVGEFIESIPKNIASFWTDINLPIYPERQNTVTIKNFTTHSTYILEESLRSLSVNIDDSEDFFVVLTDNYISKSIEEFNIKRKADGKPWMLLKPSGRVAWIGPIFIFGLTGCWNCLAEKLKINRRVEVDLFGTNNEFLEIKSPTYLPTISNVAMSIAANEVAKWVRSKNHHLMNHLVTLDFRDLETRKHLFSKHRDCYLCDVNKEQKHKKIDLLSSKKNFFYRTGERNCSLDDTYDKIKDIVSPVTGIVSSMNHTKINNEHICYTIRNLPIPNFFNKDDRYIRIPDAATGKGQSKLSATVGCLAEAIERYNCSFTNQREHRCDFREIEGSAIHPHDLLNFSQRQYDQRDKLNKKNCGFNLIPKEYDGTSIGWTGTYSVLDEKIIYVPSSYCYLYYPFHKDSEICPGNSNGCASGNSLEEAIFYGILELIERDAIGIWWYNRIKRPSVNLDIFDDFEIMRIRKTFDDINRVLYVLDITTELQVPTFVAVSWKHDGSEIFFGSGAHINPHLAVNRAISELNQTMIRSNTPKEINLMEIPEIERDLVKWSITERIQDHVYLVPSEFGSRSYQYEESGDFLFDIQSLLTKFERLNMKVLLLDMSDHTLPFHTARVIIPGLRHSWARLAPGRLYDVPVSLGWLKDERTESEMNPISYFL